MTPAAASGDVALVNASLAGNLEAFGQIVSRYQSLVCSVAYSATGSLTQSEDLAQETFIAAWKHLADLREPEKLRAWLCGIARNLINSALRTQDREPSHYAESLDQVSESCSPEPLPVERAISQEEADILWRSLERIPETYRLPLVLFYREHQSVEAVAENLDLTEEAVRQRLSRGRKLLQDEVLDLVEVALKKTSPGRMFTMAVVGALPIAVSSAKAASAGVVVAKAGAEAKSVFALSAWGGMLAMLGAVLFSWKTTIDESTSPRERRFMVRMGWFQIGFFVVSLGICFYWLPRLTHQPVAVAIVLGLLILVTIINAVLTTTYLGRRRMQIRMEEGAMAEPNWTDPGPESDRQALRKSLKFAIPFLVMFAVGSFGLPWKEHWIRCAVVVAVEGLVILWAVRKFYKQLSFQFKPNLEPSKIQRILRHPAVIFPGVCIGAALIGALLPLYLNPGASKSTLVTGPLLRTVSLGILGALLVYALFAVVFMLIRKKIPGIGGWLPWMPKTLQKPEAIIDESYTPLFQQLNLNSDQITHLKDLILKKTQAQVRNCIALMNRKLDTAQRTELSGKLKSETDAYDTQIAQTLGEANYPVFKQYEVSVPNRTMIGLFCSKSAGTAQALSSVQKEQLIQALNEARIRFPWSTDISRRNLSAGGYLEMLNTIQFDTFAREEELFERQFLTQAQRILRPEQLAAFENFQKRQRQSQIAGLRMAARLYAPKT
jgi:RNA polymerase sigma factor (sigma-70 family)